MIFLSRRSVLVGALIGISPVRAQNAVLKFDRRVAIRGHDPVAYFTEGRPVLGTQEYASDFDDVTYWFASPRHRDMFRADPDRYAPQFGGFCAVTISRGGIADPDPEAWTIADGKLYLFRAKEGVTLFQRQSASILGKAAEQWPSLQKQP